MTGAYHREIHAPEPRQRAKTRYFQVHNIRLSYFYIEYILLVLS